MIIHYNYCTIGSILLHSFLLICHPYPPSFHEMIFILVVLWSSACNIQYTLVDCARNPSTMLCRNSREVTLLCPKLVSLCPKLLLCCTPSQSALRHRPLQACAMRMAPNALDRLWPASRRLPSFLPTKTSCYQ